MLSNMKQSVTLGHITLISKNLWQKYDIAHSCISYTINSCLYNKFHIKFLPHSVSLCSVACYVAGSRFEALDQGSFYCKLTLPYMLSLWRFWSGPCRYCHTLLAFFPFLYNKPLIFISPSVSLSWPGVKQRLTLNGKLVIITDISNRIRTAAKAFTVIAAEVCLSGKKRRVWHEKYSTKDYGVGCYKEAEI